QFVRKRAAQAWTKFDQLQAGAKVVSGVSGSQIGMTPIEGLGDTAYVLPAGMGVMVLKGDAFFGMTFFAWPGQDKAIALAKRVAEHLLDRERARLVCVFSDVGYVCWSEDR